MKLDLPIYAHTLGDNPADWETLDHHAGAVATLAGQFASALGAFEWGTLLGLWHDLGKASAAFQDYLRLSNDPDAAEEGARPGWVDHSTFGARHAISFIERTADVYREALKQGATLGLVEHHSGVD